MPSVSVLPAGLPAAGPLVGRSPRAPVPLGPCFASMLRQVASRFIGPGLRGISTSAARLEEAAPAGIKEFTEAWQKTAPSTLAPPEFPTNFLPAEAPRDAAVDGEKFQLNFYTPHGVVSEGKVGVVW